jgi:hypothetical protein
MRNSVKQIEEYLSLTIMASENRIMKDVFGYDRNTSPYSNKKYAELLRRGLDKGLYKRIKTKFPGIRSTVFYYKAPMVEFIMMVDFNHSEMFDFVMKNELR